MFMKFQKNSKIDDCAILISIIYNPLNKAISLRAMFCSKEEDNKENADEELPVYMDKVPVLIIAQSDPAIMRYSRMHPKLKIGFYDAVKTAQLLIRFIESQGNIELSFF